ncbi:MAG: hypothetical protein GWN67_20005 [Phycisphaerae bacterium]|nr:hypothetical protein [Phycisphaerae bacterium]NIP54399.1 hypothetical protein [Phycisphaerae bacterium]NIS53258.1 hypothetical protein [Phycisphaerae bacterium]NIU10784.1 hypothetical protein [Phycisphaerae bacterium]NIU58579.1 hypothetical protein [Phycisphaerae bacterium]
MRLHAARFTNRLAFVCVILILTVGTGLITGHMESVVTPTWGVNSDCVTIMPVMLNYPGVLAGGYLQEHISRPMQSKANVSKLKLFEDVFGSVTDLVSPLDYPKIDDIYDFDTLCEMIIAGSVTENKEIEDNCSASNLQEERETKIFESEQYAKDTAEILEVSDTEVVEPPAEPVFKRIRTKVKSIETVLRKAVIKPYHNINGQIEGLQISGLEKVLVAKDLLLKSGDVIRVVNGQLLSSKKVASKVFRKARKLPIMEVELLRNGKTMTFQYYLK